MLPLRGKIINVEKSRIDKVLQNIEIQALITAIGTNVREEFNIEDARYHRVILATDADVDGAHIRTLALTFIYREMPELIDAGYVYIAKPPLYRVKNGKQEIYVEKESELEEFLLRDKLEEFEVAGADGKKRKLSKRRWQSFNRKLKEYEGWMSSLQAGVRPSGRSTSCSESQVLDAGAATLAGVKKLIEAKDPPEEPFETELVKATKEKLVVKAIHRRTRPRANAPAPGEALRVQRLPQARRGPRRAARARSAVRRSRSASARRATTPSRSPPCAARSSSSRATASRCSASRASAR